MQLINILTNAPSSSSSGGLFLLVFLLFLPLLLTGFLRAVRRTLRRKRRRNNNRKRYNAQPSSNYRVTRIPYSHNYYESSYYKVTHLPYEEMMADKGRRGEYNTYSYLSTFENLGAKILFNVYVQKPDGTYTEIDQLMICGNGIIVFEIKNYKGWIFGSEDREKWCQSLKGADHTSQKEYFYNPIWQNDNHIKFLQQSLNAGFPIYSMVVFSNECQFKEINTTRNNVRVVHEYEVADAVGNIWNNTPSNYLSPEGIENIYNKLYSLTQVSAEVKAQHIQTVRNAQGHTAGYAPNSAAPQTAPTPAPAAATPPVVSPAPTATAPQSAPVPPAAPPAVVPAPPKPRRDKIQPPPFKPTK